MEDKQFTLKDLVQFIIIAASIVGSFTVMQVQVSNTKAEVAKIQTTLENNNLELIVYRLEETNKKIDDLTNTLNRFIDTTR